MSLRVFLILCVSSALFCKVICNCSSAFRLSPDIQPIHYDVFIRLDLQRLTFKGSVSINLNIENETDRLTLHSTELNIADNVTFFGENGEVSMSSKNVCTVAETVTVIFGQSIRGKGRLQLYFSSKLVTEQVQGIYALRTFNGSEERISVATDFEATNARRFIPCFDEPSFKATFLISVVVPKDRTVLSNMPVLSRTPISETEVKVVFDKSPKMSTYLNCLIVGDYDYVEKMTADGRVRLRVYTPVGKSKEGQFALDTAVRSVEFLEKYLGVQYTLPKLDLIALKDLEPAAMENWGLITCQEMFLLVNDETPIWLKQEIALVVTHEVAHQWFGNLVTCEWWTHTWVQEGFANFFEHLITNELYKEWNHLSIYLADHYSKALEMDSYHNSHPITLDHVDNDDIMDQSFDSVIYNKGGAVIRMISEWIGEKEFREGLNRYLNTHKYGNGGTDDVANALNNVSNKNVIAVMESWFKQKNYPTILLASTSCDRVRLKQLRFPVSSSNTEAEKEMIWTIPIAILFKHPSKNETSNKKFLMKRRVKFWSSHCVNDWNFRSIGFYRMHYSWCDFRILMMKLQNAKLNPEQRFTLQNNFYAHAKEGMVSTVEYLEFLKHYANEDRLFVWQSITTSISEISDLISNTNCSKNMKAYIRNLYSNIHSKLNNTEDNSDITIQLRALVYKRLGLSGDKNIVNDAFKKFDDYFNRNKTIEPNFRSAVFEIVASNATDETYDKFFDLYRRHNHNANLRYDYIKAMGSSGKPEQLRRALKFSISTDVTISDSYYIISSVGDSSDGLAWQFFVDNFELYKKRFEKKTSLISGITSHFNTTSKMDEIKQFFETHKFKGIRATLRLSVEKVENRVKWFKKDAVDICDYLNDDSNLLQQKSNHVIRTVDDEKLLEFGIY